MKNKKKSGIEELEEELGKEFPRETIEIGGKTGEQLITEMEDVGVHISENAKFILKSPSFIPSNKEEITLVRLTVADLGFTENATTDQIYERAKELGLELCSSDTASYYRLAYQNQPLWEWIYIGMKQIVGFGGNLNIFLLMHHDDGLWLNISWAKPDHEWILEDTFIFRLRKSR
ncbi:MAG: hypothetical protein HZA35_00005 [Parcubacteria group bacterium]|nr:hypothetical protein [Parcubacteria group bacterium]